MNAVDWSALHLDPASPVPRYHQLAEWIAARVRDGSLPPGDRLPPERDLAEAAGISRMTARQALAALVREGVIVVRHGVGTFVAAPKLTYDALTLLGFGEETARQGIAVATRLLERAIEPVSPPIAETLALPPGATALRIVRLRLAGETPVLLQTSWLPADRCPDLIEANLEDASLYALLSTHCGIRLGSASQTVEAIPADVGQAALMGVDRGVPLLRVAGVVRDDAGRPVEAFRADYRADRVRIALDTRTTGSPDTTSERLSLVIE
ncbi:MAG: GntR family transcriptional regulator [Thermomicrobiales bacterium]|nr:GntR family transcriptional regulator [Thermomicrobiales bacterium]